MKAAPTRGRTSEMRVDLTNDDAGTMPMTILMPRAALDDHDFAPVVVAPAVMMAPVAGLDDDLRRVCRSGGEGYGCSDSGSRQNNQSEFAHRVSPLRFW